MLILKKLKLNNFLSHTGSEIEFEDNVKLSLEGVSGSGKSSIVEAILWVLFGKGRADNRSMIKRGAKNGSVMVELADGDTSYRITREVSEKGKQTLELERKENVLGWEPISKTGLKDAQDYIEKELLKSSYLLFINSVIYPQDNAESFVKQTAGKRKELLLEIVGAEDYDTYYTRAKSLASVTAEALTRISIELDSLRRTREENAIAAAALTTLQENEKRLKSEIEIIEKMEEEKKAKEQEWIKVKNEKSVADSRLLGKINEKNILTKRKDAIFFELNQEELPKYTIEEIEEKILHKSVLENQAEEIIKLERAEATRRGQLMAIMADKPHEIDYDKEIDSLKKQMEGIASGTDTFCIELGRACPSLQKQVDNQTGYYREQIKSKEDSKNIQSIALDNYSKKLALVGPEIKFEAETLNRLRIEIGSLNKYVIEKETMAIRSENRKKNTTVMQTLETDIMLVDMQISEIEKEIKDIDLNLNLLIPPVSALIDPGEEKRRKYAEFNDNAVKLSMAEKAAEKVAQLDTQVTEKIDKQRAETEKFEELTMVKEAFGSTGIKSVVVDYILPGLEEKINETLSKLSDFRITLDTQRKSLTDEKMIEGLFINIYNGQGEMFDYDSFSGGQKNRVAYALFEGLASIQKCNFRIFDESIAGLDDETINAFSDVMLQLNTEDRQIICVSHIQAIKDIFPEKITVVNVDGESKIL